MTQKNTETVRELQQTIEEYENEEKRTAYEIAAYKQSLGRVLDRMMESAILSEGDNLLMLDVWNNAVYKEKDPKTDPYVRPDGVFVQDFNDALNNLYEDPGFSNNIDHLYQDRYDIQNIMKEMMTPPEKMEEAHEILLEAYDAYMIMTGITVSPNGSLISVREEHNAADEILAHCFDRLKLFTE